MHVAAFVSLIWTTTSLTRPYNEKKTMEVMMPVKGMKKALYMYGDIWGLTFKACTWKYQPFYVKRRLFKTPLQSVPCLFSDFRSDDCGTCYKAYNIENSDVGSYTFTLNPYFDGQHKGETGAIFDASLYKKIIISWNYAAIIKSLDFKNLNGACIGCATSFTRKITSRPYIKSIPTTIRPITIITTTTELMIKHKIQRLIASTKCTCSSSGRIFYAEIIFVVFMIIVTMHVT